MMRDGKHLPFINQSFWGHPTGDNLSTFLMLTKETFITIADRS